MTEQNKTKRQFIIFLLIAYGLTYVMGIVTWYGSILGAEISVFANVQMFYPAAGVMLAYLVTQWKDELLPRWFYICFLAITLLMAACCVFAIIMPGEPISLNGQILSLWSLIQQCVMIVGNILCWITLLISRRERREEYGLTWENWKESLFCILIFLVLYFGRAVATYVLNGEPDMILDIVRNPMTLAYLISMPVNFVICFAAFSVKNMDGDIICSQFCRSGSACGGVF